MLVWDAGKKPTETDDFDIDWSLRLGTDTIISSTWSIITGDAPASGTLATNSNSYTTTRTKVWLSAGNLGVTYTLLNTVLTANGDTLTEYAQLPVRNIPPAANDLTTLATAMQWLGVTTDDNDYVARLITSLSTLIQNVLSYNILQATYTRTFNGQGNRRFFVPDLPLVSVSSLTIDGVSIPAGSFITGGGQNPGYYNDAHSIGLIGYCFTRGFQNVTMTYVAGRAFVPPDIEQACLDWIKIVWANGQMVGIGTNAVRIAAGDTSINFGGKGAVTDPKLIPMPQSIYVVLQNYQRVAQISGY